jgi:hypothetical protein
MEEFYPLPPPEGEGATVCVALESFWMSEL